MAADVNPVFLFARAVGPGDLPPPDQRIVDVALLDMHHGWPNLGHDAIVHAIARQARELHESLAASGFALRVISYDVRRGHAIPEPPGGRHDVYVGTGGPGHLDPARNDGVDPGSQGIAEDPAWEPHLFALFDAIAADESASLIGVCHTFGVMCRWLGIADAVLRPASKGGKSAGIVDNVLTAEALEHPWFSRFAGHLPDRTHFKVLDNRLYDLVPRGALTGVVPLAYEALGPGGPPGDALTMIEVGQAAAGGVPRVLGLNHHPEIGNRETQLTVLRDKWQRGEVSDEWYAERLATLTQPLAHATGDPMLRLTSVYTLVGPMRTHVRRALLRRGAPVGEPVPEREGLVEE